MDEPQKDRARARKERTQARARGDILEAALRAFKASGYRGTKMADIAAQAGYTAASLYTYFPSKREILEAIADQMIDELVAALGPDAVVAAGGSVADAFAALEADLRPRVHKLCAWADSRREGLAYLCQLRWSQDIEHDERSRSHESSQLARVHAHLVAVFGRHGHDAESADAHASALMGLFEQLVWRLAAPEARGGEGLAVDNLARRADRLADLILFGAKGRR